jgi:tRNA A-37 threonylcarbamoyl transferase component Bud32
VTDTPAFELDLSLQVGKYDIQKLLGKGATGTVYLARDTFSGREVALKTIEPEVFRDPEFGLVYRAQFLNEASLAGKLRHPHIVGIYDAVVQDDSGHIAMELVTGGDLSRHVDAKRLLPVPDVLEIGFKCCGALDYAFREGIVHRDIKPANIMLAQGTDPKIADFGAAYLRKSQVVQVASMGSPFYMSPEQIAGAEPTFHSDMFSLGVVLYELLTGKRPFVADTIEALVAKILNASPAPPSSLRKGLKPEIDSAVLRAMKKNPEHRYASWGDFAQELSSSSQAVAPGGAILDSEKYLALKQVEMLKGLQDAILWELVRAGRWTRVEKGKVLVRENDPGSSFFFLAQGQAKVVKGGRLLNVLNPGEYYGEMAYLWSGNPPRQATVESMTDILIAEYESSGVEHMAVETQLHLMRSLARNLADRLALANTRLVR